VQRATRRSRRLLRAGEVKSDRHEKKETAAHDTVRTGYMCCISAVQFKRRAGDLNSPPVATEPHAMRMPQSPSVEAAGKIILYSYNSMVLTFLA
jgi:hypothetical protein